MIAALAATACLAVAAVSLLIPAAPGYDAWAWLAWGRELVSLELSTAEGPAFKPLAVAVCALLVPFGNAAPELWLVLARAGAAAALVLAFLAARSLAGPGRRGLLAGALAAAGVALTGGFFLRAAVGDTEPLLLALALAALLRTRAEAHGQALALAAAAALLRPEVWPFLGLYGLWLWREHPRLRAPAAALAVAIPAAWLVPEWLGSGDLLRSGSRALVPNPGQPALADVPGLESLRRAGGLLFPVAAGVLLLRTRDSRLVAAAGLGWVLLVAAMAQAGFSGEERYLFPGAALLAVAGAVGVARTPPRPRRPAAALAGAPIAAAVVALAVIRLIDIAGIAPALRHSDRLAADLPRAIAAAGGRDALLARGAPAVGRFRGTLLAYHLRVEKRRIRADGRPGPVTFRSRLRGTDPLTPPSPARARPLVIAGEWRIESAGVTPPRGRAAAGRR